MKLMSFMDEAGHFKNPTSLYVGMAGFVAPDGIWDGAAEVWRSITQGRFRLKRPFHMKDLAHRRGEFTGWGEARRKALISNLVEIILLSQLRPVAAVVSSRDYKSLNLQQRTNLRSPYHICFQTCTRGAALIAFPDSQIRMVYSENIEYGATQQAPSTPYRQLGNAAQLWSVMKSRTDLGQWMESCSFSTPTETVQLQMADLFAYEICKEFENLQKRPGAPMRWALRQILKLEHEEFAMIRFFDRKELLRLVIEAGLPDTEGTGEVGDAGVQLIAAQRERTRWFRTRTREFDTRVGTPTERDAGDDISAQS
jgi:hypothetical protein